MADHQSDDPKQPSKAEVQARLADTAASISERVEALQREAKDTPASIRAVMRRHPLLSLGGTLAAGLLVGLWWGGRRKRRLTKAHQELINHYIDTIRNEVRHAVANGAEVDTAVKEALRHRTPLVVHTADGEEGSTSGWLRNLFDIILDTALALFVREGLDAWLSNIDLDQKVADLAAQDGV